MIPLRVRIALGCAVAGAVLSAEPTRVATSLPILLANPVFFHSRTVALVAMPVQVEGIWQIPVPAPQTLAIVWRNGAPRPGTTEIRGTFYDIGRFAPDDSRIAAEGITALVRLMTKDVWPKRETFFVLGGATWIDSPSEKDVSIRNIALMPDRFDGQTVTLRGRFRGQNVFGDLPSWPRQSAWDFILQTNDGAIWITGMHPRGRNFDFDPTSRRDTSRWLEVSGVVHLAKGFPYVTAKTMQLSDPIEDAPVGPPAPPPLPPPVPQVIFSAPTGGETDVPPSVLVKIQFSGDMRVASFDEHVHVRYGNGVSATPPAFTVTYRPASFAIEIKFAAPLLPLTAVTIDLDKGVLSRDGIPLAATSVTFTTGASTP